MTQSMSAQRRILVATDLSEHSERAVARARVITESTNGVLTILHVVDDRLPKDLAEKQRSLVEAQFAKRVAAMRPEARQRTNWSVATGRDYKVILECAARNECGLIVLGIHRDELMRDLLIGSTLQRVIRNAQVPVLVVRNRSRAAYRRVVVGVDFSEEAELALDQAVIWFPDAEFRLIHAYDVPFQGFLAGRSIAHEISERSRKESEDFTRKFLSARRIPEAKRARFVCELSLGVDVDVLKKETARRRAQLLVIGRHGRSGFGALGLGGAAAELLANPPADMMIGGANPDPDRRGAR
jgi:nucleotide-binding universal stress UspA family protein